MPLTDTSIRINGEPVNKLSIHHDDDFNRLVRERYQHFDADYAGEEPMFYERPKFHAIEIIVMLSLSFIFAFGFVSLYAHMANAVDVLSQI